MAVGDRHSAGDDAVASDGFVDFAAPSSTEVVLMWAIIQNGKAVEIYYTNDSGTTNVLIDSIEAGGSVNYQGMRCTPTEYIRAKNVSGGAAGIWLNGVVSKA